jgi:hypothetical protein
MERREGGGRADGSIVTNEERQVADLLPIEVDPTLAATVEAAPFLGRSRCSVVCSGFLAACT